MDGSSDQGYIYKLIDATIGTEYLLEFRTTFKNIVLEKSEKFIRWNPCKKPVQQAGLNAAKDARSVWLDKLAMIPSLVAFVGGIVFNGVHWIIPLIGLLLFIILAIRRTAVEVLLYTDPYRFRSPDDMKFAYVWNTAMGGWTSYAILPVAFLARIYPKSYITGMWIVDKFVEEYDAVEYQ